MLLDAPPSRTIYMLDPYQQGDKDRISRYINKPTTNRLEPHRPDAPKTRVREVRRERIIRSSHVRSNTRVYAKMTRIRSAVACRVSSRVTPKTSRIPEWGGVQSMYPPNRWVHT
ncbi:uncharacterized protein MCYG_06042 [Microsporum canis CBS 113480]|uniref:Uncharacterized protein n=1 Tax=Arthroderma otae (strain ATCC MYA-4605 / CBS 113480) TaxID=554155 RepID=C5FTM0_ARTOC|nr:uncharacterized protein MCYG_06042 [Microsporum canis CBS 113480]EEQ33223.1 predicted protein [Microsporum canis CBS 113480]